ncbi:MAG: hypothetical protein JNK04_01195 [Myxococcales bacterium]|nr:hypothetical protein [Myxococcales bacterium]
MRFADLPHRARTLRDAERARAIVLAPTNVKRAGLARVFDSEMETLLALRGAMPPSVAADADYGAVVDDQIARAVTLPVRGICIAFPRLAELCEGGVLCAEDGAVVRAWMNAARTEKRLRLVVLFDEGDRAVDLWAPIALDALVAGAPASEEPRSPTSSFTPTPEPVLAREDESVAAPLVIALAADEPAAPAEAPELSLPALDLPAPMATPVKIAETLRPPAPLPQPVFEGDLQLDEEALAIAGVLSDEALSGLPSPVAVTPPRARRVAPPTAVAPPPRVPSIEEEKAAADHAARLLHLATHRTYSLDLDAARGPKPVALVEKLYAQRYVPLIGAIARDEADDAVRDIVSEWRKSFAESYEAAYEAIRLTGKRPTMVMDAPEVAHRVARLASARSVKLILVDSMSFDLGERVEKRVAAALVKRAVLVEKTVLWAALPSTTPTQAHLLARGVDGLRDVPGPSSEPDITRGRSVSTLRRERLGGREIIKLDLVEARLRSQGPAYDERLDTLADEIAEILVKLLDSLPPRTLAYVFGDHGFTLPPGTNGHATGASSQGGSSPEEVLVSGHGWLVDAVQ